MSGQIPPTARAGEERLSPRQREIAQALDNLDPQLGGMYVHAVQLLARIEDPGIAGFVAQAGREISRGVLRILTAEAGSAALEDIEATGDSPGNRAAIAKALQLPPNDPRVQQWFRLPADFSTWMKFRQPGPPAQDVREAFERFSSLLFGRVGPYFATQAELDSLLAVSTPTASDVVRLQQLLLRPAQRAYFFSRVPAAWAPALAAAGAFKNPPDRTVDRASGTWTATPWPEGQYLVRIAGEASDTVSEAIKALSPGIQNPVVWEVAASAGRTLPVESASWLVKLLGKGLANSPVVFTDAFVDLVSHLAKERREEAFALARHLCAVPAEPPPLADGQNPIRLTLDTRWMLPKLGWHRADAFITGVVPLLEALDPKKTLWLLVDIVKDIDRLLGSLPESTFSRGWRHALDGSHDRDDVPGMFLAVTAEVAERFASTTGEAAATVMHILGKQTAPVFAKVRARVLASAGTFLRSALDEFLESSDTIDPGYDARETALVLRRQFANASPRARRLFCYSLRRGPEAERIKALLQGMRGIDDPSDEDIDEAVRDWQRRRLVWFRGDFPEELRSLAAELDLLGKTTTHEEQELAEVGFYSSVGVGRPFAAEASPVSYAGLSPQEVVAKLRDGDASSEEALGEYAAADPGAGVLAASLLLQEGLHPPSLNGALIGLRRAADGGAPIDWVNLMPSLCTAVKAAARSSGAAAAVDARRAMALCAELLSAGLDKDAIPISPEPAVWEVLSTAVSAPVIASSTDDAAFSSLEAIVMACLNDVVGHMVQAIVSAALWSYRDRKRGSPDGHSPSTSSSSDELVQLLDQVLSWTGRSGIVAQATLGRYVPQLQLLAPEWLHQNETALFEGGDLLPLERPAWAAYITHAAFYDAVFRALRPWYVRGAAAAALAAKHDDVPDRHLSATSHLAQHAVIAVIRGQASPGDEDRFVEQVFGNVPVRDRAQAYWGIFRGWSDSEEAPGDELIARVVAFWKWRLASLAASATPEAKEEATGLGWLLRTPYIPSAVVVELGLETARLAQGELEFYSEWERMRELAAADPDRALRIAELVLTAQLRQPHGFVPVDDVMPFLELVMRIGPDETKQRAVDLIHRLGERGYGQFGALLPRQSSQ